MTPAERYRRANYDRIETVPLEVRQRIAEYLSQKCDETEQRLDRLEGRRAFHLLRESLDAELDALVCLQAILVGHDFSSLLLGVE